MASFNVRRITCTAPVNIAVIKYWGKANEELIVPLNSSLSVTLHQEQLCSTTSVALCPSFDRDRIWLNGVEDDINSTRLQRCLKEIRQLASTSSKRFTPDEISSLRIHICSKNNFPTAAGLASSASGFACLVYALAQAFGVEVDHLSEIARQGSGSACRSVYGGFVEWQKGEMDGRGSRAVQVAPDHHWPELEALILVVSDSKKPVGSTQGMQSSVRTSPLLQFRADEVVPQRIKEMREAIKNKDFQKFGLLTMKDSNQFHAVCLDTFPPIFYLNDTSKYIIQLVTQYNQYKGGVAAAYTFDAGPNAVIFAEKENIPELLSVILNYLPSTLRNYIRGVSCDVPPISQGITQVITMPPRPEALQYIIHTRIGPGPQLLTTDTTGVDNHLLDNTGCPSLNN